MVTDVILKSRSFLTVLGEEVVLNSAKKPTRCSIAHGSGIAAPMASSIATQSKASLLTLHKLLSKLLSSNIPPLLHSHDEYLEEISDPGAQPFVWISKVSLS